jgi:hypothetical protein
MPGRKSLLVLTPNTDVPSRLDLQFMPQYNAVADEALRAEVVIHTFDIKGLQGPELYDEEFGADKPGSGRTGPERASRMMFRTAARYRDPQSPLSKKTGGLFVEGSNFFNLGAGIVSEAMKGFYLLSYIPPPGTFTSIKGDLYHRIQVKTKLRGSTVYSRDGFFGVPKPSTDTSMIRDTSLEKSLTSPFLNNDLKVRLASGYAKNPGEGYFVECWIHLDAKDLTFVDEKDGGHSLSLKAAVLTTDIDGSIQDALGRKFEFYVKDENLPQIQENGVSFNLFLPVKNPGYYYVRTAIKDSISGKVGSAYQFIEIPNLKKKHLSLSSIFVQNHDDTLSKMQSEKIEANDKTSDSVQALGDSRKSPALKIYKPGDSLDSLSVVYNAKVEKGLAPSLDYQIILFKDGEVFSKSEIAPVELNRTKDWNTIPIVRKLSLSKTLAPGEYILQLQVTDNRAKKKYSVASQAIDFEIRK